MVHLKSGDEAGAAEAEGTGCRGTLRQVQGQEGGGARAAPEWH